MISQLLLTYFFIGISWYVILLFFAYREYKTGVSTLKHKQENLDEVNRSYGKLLLSSQKIGFPKQIIDCIVIISIILFLLLPATLWPLSVYAYITDGR